MDDKMFDAWMRRAVRATDRRAVLGLLSSVILATVPSLTLAGNDHGHGSGGNGKHGEGGKHKGGKKGGKGKGGKKSKCGKDRLSREQKCDKDGLNQEECEENYGTCTDSWASYCNTYYTGDLRVSCQSSFISCCADLLECTEQANARHVNCVSILDQTW